MDIVIRKAALADLKAIQKLNLLLFEKEYEEYDQLLDTDWTFSEEGTAYFKERIDDGCVVVAISDDMVVGYLCGGLTRAESYRKLPTTAELENMFVLEKHRSKGIGKMLMDAFLDWCKTKGAGIVRVKSDARNTKAIDFYKKAGFLGYTLVLEKQLNA
jgi:GNAT superfamily N-acetyltransferase